MNLTSLPNIELLNGVRRLRGGDESLIARSSNIFAKSNRASFMPKSVIRI